MAKRLRGQHREQPHRAPAAGAPRDRRQHGDRGPAQRRRPPSSAVRRPSSTGAEPGRRRRRIRGRVYPASPPRKGPVMKKARSHFSPSSSPRSPSSPAAAAMTSSSTTAERERTTAESGGEPAAAKPKAARPAAPRRSTSKPTERRTRLHDRQRHRQGRQGDDRIQQPAGDHPRRRDRRRRKARTSARPN